MESVGLSQVIKPKPNDTEGQFQTLPGLEFLNKSVWNFLISPGEVICLMRSLLCSEAQVPNTRPKGQIQPSALFYTTWHLVSARRQC